MNRIKTHPFLSVLLLAVPALTSCSGKNATVVTTPGGNGTVAVTMVADTLPANPSLLSFQVTIASITFTPASGTATSITLIPALTVDLMRLQSDTVFLGAFANIPAAQYTSATLSLSGNANITLLNDTGSTLTTSPTTTCPASTICSLSVAASSNPVATVSFTVSQNAVTGIGIDLNFANAVSISGSPANLVVKFSNNNVLSAFTLPRANSNLAAGQLDLIEDFTGVVSLNTNAVTIASSTRGTLTATATTNTILDADPSRTLCVNPTQGQVSSCVSNNQVASMDVVLKSDGTLSIQEIEPLLATARDTVEGIVVSITPSSQTQFNLVVTDLIPAATNSLIGSLHIGDGLTVNLPNTVSPFLVDTKGLLLLSGSSNNFAGGTTTTAIHLGQSVTVHVITPFTAAVGTTIASTNTDTVTLRWSRFTATPQTASTPSFTIVNLPTYFGFPLANIFSVQTATSGTAGVTNFDGVSNGGGLSLARPVALRALFLENTTNSANPAFFAAKVRQH